MKPYTTSQVGLAQLGVAQLADADNVTVSGTPTIAATSYVASRVAFGNGSAQFPPQDVNITAYIPSRVAFGSGSLATGIDILYVIPSRVAFGNGALLTQTYISLFLDGVDISRMLLVDSLNITNPLSNSATASFSIWDKTGELTISVGQEVEIYLGQLLIFGGSIEQPFQTAFQAFPGGAFLGSAGSSSGGVGSATSVSSSSGGGSGGAVQCTDFSNLLDRRYVGLYFDGNGAPTPTLLTDIVAYIVQTYFAQDGITYDDSDGDPGINVGPQLFNWVTGRQAFNTLSSATGWDFSVDYRKVLRFFPASSGLDTAPFNVADDNGVVFAESLGIEYYRSTYRNRQGVRSPTASTQLWSDIFSTAQPGPFPNEPQPPDGTRRTFIQLYGFTAIPTVTVNGVLQTVGQLTDTDGFVPPLSQIQWYIIQPVSGFPSFGLYQNGSNPALSSSDVLVISYPTPISPIYWVQNDAQINERAIIEGNSGIYEDVEDAPSVTDPLAIQAYAQALLDRYSSAGMPFQVTYSTRNSQGIFAGQTQQIESSNPPIPVFTGLVSNVAWQDVDGQYMQLSVTVLSGQYQGNFTQFFAALVAQGVTLPQPSAFVTYTFPIAPSWPGVTNPGLTGGSVATIANVVQNAVELIQSLQVYLPTANSSDTQFFVFDVATSTNLVSVFFLAGQSGTQTTQVPASAPIRVYAGDVLKISIGGAVSPVMDAIATLVTSIAAV